MKVCEIEGCGKKVTCRGLCNTHYIRLQRYSDPLYRKTIKNEGRECKHSGCTEIEVRKGYCSKHYQRFNSKGTTDDAALKNQASLSIKRRIELNITIVPETNCWDWQKQRDKNGYGVMTVGDKPLRAHRIAYEEFVGKIEDGLHVLHRCDNPSCINPEHLFLGTNAENMKDKVNKGRHAFGEKSGSAKLTEEQVIEIKKRLAAGESVNSFVDEYPVSGRAIRLIKKGTNWSHVKI
jgi:hypothetical protein